MAIIIIIYLELDQSPLYWKNHCLNNIFSSETQLFFHQNSIHFFLSRDGCGDFSPYLEVANTTYGIVVNWIDDFEAFAEFADKVGRFRLELAAIDDFKSFYRTQSIPLLQDHLSCMLQ